MDEAERLHRPELARDQPIRDFVSHFRQSGAGGTPRGKSATHSASGAVEDPVAHGVKLGYSVIEEQIRQGEKLAERLRPAQAASGPRPLEVGVLIERALNVYKDMGALALAAAESLARNPSLQAGVSRAWRGGSTPETPPAAPAAAGGSQFAIEVKSSRRVSIKLDVRPRSDRSVPHVHALHALNGSAPPLTSVRFEIDPASLAPVLRIEIDDSQPADSYSGLVVDAATNEPCGALSVRIVA